MHKSVDAVSVVIPVRNEAKTIALVVRDCEEVLTSIGLKHEIIVVDDSSTDDTAEVLKGLPCYTVRNPPPAGKGYALRRGFATAKYNTILMLDGDYSHRPEDIPLMISEFEKGFGLIVANRFLGGSDEYVIWRSLGNRFLTSLFSMLFSVHLNDAINGFKLFRREIFDYFDYVSGDFSIEIELLANTRNLGYSIGQVPSHERSRAGDKKKSFAIRHGISILSRIVQEFFRSKNKSKNIKREE